MAGVRVKLRAADETAGGAAGSESVMLDVGLDEPLAALADIAEDLDAAAGRADGPLPPPVPDERPQARGDGPPPPPAEREPARDDGPPSPSLPAERGQALERADEPLPPSVPDARLPAFEDVPLPFADMQPELTVKVRYEVEGEIPPGVEGGPQIRANRRGLQSDSVQNTAQRGQTSSAGGSYDDYSQGLGSFA